MRGNPMDYYLDQLFRPAGATGATDAAAGSTSTGTTMGTTMGTETAPATPGMPMTAMPNGQAGDLGPVRAEIRSYCGGGAFVASYAATIGGRHRDL